MKTLFKVFIITPGFILNHAISTDDPSIPNLNGLNNQETILTFKNDEIFVQTPNSE